ncbi:hypothetical protein D1007_01302 [Hordeum vulgare]|nr:hypothetical protein D1007_01302 [Hordeum vulgare]
MYCTRWEANTWVRQWRKFITNSFRGVRRHTWRSSCVDHTATTSDSVSPIQVREQNSDQQIQLPVEDTGSKRGWMPKMDFPRFDGTEVRIWIDRCKSFFQLYNIPKNFKVTSASLYLTDNAAHWYQSVKQLADVHSWERFCAAAILELDVNVYRQKMKELLSLKQVDNVEVYKQQFLQLVYHVKLYEPALSDTFLFTRFTMGLKEELRSVVELQMPTTIQLAAMYASVQEGLLSTQKQSRAYYGKPAMGKFESKGQLSTGELWKAKQLNEYRRANGLCYKCGEKFIPGHTYVFSRLCLGTFKGYRSGGSS